MRVAIALSEGHVCQRLDCAEQLLLVQVENGTERNREAIDLRGWPAHGRGTRIAHMRVDRLVCGAVSRFDEAGLHDSDVQLIGGVTGPIETVLAAVVLGTIAPEKDYWTKRLAPQGSVPNGCGGGAGMR